MIIQTFSPDHYAIQAAIQHDYPRFYKQEILFRQELKYPAVQPLRQPDLRRTRTRAKAQARATALVVALERLNPQDVEIIGPSAAPLARLKNQFRFHVALRAPVTIRFPTWYAPPSPACSATDRLGIIVDMDPLSMA